MSTRCRAARCRRRHLETWLETCSGRPAFDGNVDIGRIDIEPAEAPSGSLGRKATSWTRDAGGHGGIGNFADLSVLCNLFFSGGDANANTWKTFVPQKRNFHDRRRGPYEFNNSTGRAVLTWRHYQLSRAGVQAQHQG